MGMGISLFLLAAGAIITFAVDVQNSNGIDWDAVGMILMVIGGIGLLFSLIFWSSWGGWGRRDEVVYDGAPRRRTIIEQ